MSTHKKDGPPSYYVDVSKISDAVPKKEPLSRIGNKPTYTVFGKQYHVMQKRQPYTAIGVASWYGTMFDKHRTSNGERYDMLAMTAAHRSLPLPTYVRVTNLENGHRVIVKVNDRGPFKHDRLIDLSYAAARKLGMIGHGTALVEVKAISPDLERLRQPSLFVSRQHSKAKHPGTTKSEVSLVYLEVGKFRHKSYAARLQQRLNKLVPHHSKIATLTQGSRVFYQVQIGPIKDAPTVEKITHRLKSLGLASKRIDYAL